MDINPKMFRQTYIAAIVIASLRGTTMWLSHHMRCPTRVHHTKHSAKPSLLERPQPCSSRFFLFLLPLRSSDNPLRPRGAPLRTPGTIAAGWTSASKHLRGSDGRRSILRSSASSGMRDRPTVFYVRDSLVLASKLFHPSMAYRSARRNLLEQLNLSASPTYRLCFWSFRCTGACSCPG